MKDSKDKEDLHRAPIIIFPGQFTKPEVPEIPPMLAGFIRVPPEAVERGREYLVRYHAQYTQLNQLLITNPLNTWLTLFTGKPREGLYMGDLLVIEQARCPQVGSLIIFKWGIEPTIGKVLKMKAGRAGTFTATVRVNKKTLDITSDEVQGVVTFIIHKCVEGEP